MFEAVLIFAISIVSIFCGLIFARLLDPERRLEFWERVITASAVGFTVFGFAALGSAVITRNLTWGIGLALGIFGVISIVFHKSLREELGRLTLDFRAKSRLGFWPRFFVLFLFGLYIAVVLNVVIAGEDGTPQAVLKGWGDVAYHSDMIEVLANISPFGLIQPIAAGQPLTYPFFVNFWSAILRNIGLSFFAAWHLPALVFGSLLFFSVFYLAKRLLVKEILAVTLVLIVFFGGGLGFVWFFKDVYSAWHSTGLSGVFKVFLEPPYEYTHLDSRTGGKPLHMTSFQNIVWIVPAISFFSHQRSFIVGSLLAILIILGILVYWNNPKVLWRWILLAGFLPISHTHTFLAIAGMTLPILFLYNAILRPYHRVRWWILGGAIAVLIALPQIILLSFAGVFGEGRGSAFFKPWFGWMMCEHSQNPIICDAGVPGTDSNFFWFLTKNFGIVFWGWVIAAAMYAMRSIQLTARSRREAVNSVPDSSENSLVFWTGLAASSLVIFVISNFLLFQPWPFDNNKVLFYWWLFGALLWLGFIKSFSDKPHLKYWTGAILAATILVGSLSGFLDVWNRISNWRENHFGYYGKDEIIAAQWIKQNTEESDFFLTTDGANSFVPMLAGRAIYLGFSGWLWTQGGQSLIDERKNAINEFLLFGDHSKICDDGVRYLVWDEAFRASYPYADLDKITGLIERVFSQESGREIYKIKCPTLKR